jgi:hypothetical protein
LVLATTVGCFSTGGGSCDDSFDTPNSGLGKGVFYVVCASRTTPDGPTADAWCDGNGSEMYGGALPNVMTNASVVLMYKQISTGDQSPNVLVPRPAVASLATASTTSPPSWTLDAPGFVGFLVSPVDDPRVLDFTHLESVPAASLDFETTDALAGLATLYTQTPVFYTVAPLAANGDLLAGTLDCTFTVSDPDVLSATTSGGRGAYVTFLKPGSAIVIASCNGVHGTLALKGVPHDVVVDAGPDAATEDAEAGADAGDGASPEDAGDAEVLDAALDAPADAAEGE